ncbi:MAG: hypothetical protein LBE98_01235 [Puniceicoccales bacterium]|jgi:opacity protein-like surface antigen|nr:hypothetical protein [Puniceicoccales bacterium]
MKKALVVVSIICGAVGLYADEGTTASEQNFTVDTSVGFKNEYFFRGRNTLHETFISRAEIGCQIFDGTMAYAGVNSAFGIKSPSQLNHLSPCVGISYNVTDEVMLNAGFEYHFYTAIPLTRRNGRPFGVKRHSKEVHLGIIFDTFMKLSLNGFYDFDRQEVSFEGMGVYNLDLSSLFTGLGIDIWAKIGHDYTGKPLGVERFKILKERYNYYGVGADLAYRFNHARVKVGVGYEGNSAKKDSWVNGWTTFSKGMVVNASVDCSF